MKTYYWYPKYGRMLDTPPNCPEDELECTKLVSQLDHNLAILNKEDQMIRNLAECFYDDETKPDAPDFKDCPYGYAREFLDHAARILIPERYK